MAPVGLVTDRTFKRRTIDDYVTQTFRIWGAKDADRPIADVWLRAVHHASALGESLRRRLYDEAADELAHVAIWLLSFVAKLHADKEGLDRLYTSETPLSQIIWNKYPNCCPACYGRHVVLGGSHDWEDGTLHECDCILELAAVEQRNQKLSRPKKRRVKAGVKNYARRVGPNGFAGHSLMELEQVFEKMFRRNIFAQSIQDVGYHFLEEIGEVSYALASVYTYVGVEPTTKRWKDSLAEVENEVADAFSWLFAVSAKLRDTFEVSDRYIKRMSGGVVDSMAASTINVATLLWQRYGIKGRFRCRQCADEECRCDIRLVTTEAQVAALV